MANYVVEERQTSAGIQKTAGVKARDDISAILKQAGYRELVLPAGEEEERKALRPLAKAAEHVRICAVWQRALQPLKKGDTLLIQFPVINHSLLQALPVSLAKGRGIRIRLLIHDLDTLRGGKGRRAAFPKRLRLMLEEQTLLKRADELIVHNDRMKAALVELGYEAKRMKSLEIFDYLTEAPFCEPDRSLPVVIAGNLRPHKAKYVYRLPKQTSFRLYGVGYEGEETPQVEYKGSFPPEELPGLLTGSFGLVWDGPTPKTCGGAYGEYLRINNPHKTSLYLSAGLPVIIWEEAALAAFVQEQHCGFAVRSLQELPDRLGSMTEETYAEYVRGAREVGQRLRAGQYTKAALS